MQSVYAGVLDLEAQAALERFENNVEAEDLIDRPDAVVADGDDDDDNDDDAGNDDSNVFSVYGLVEQPPQSGKFLSTASNKLWGTLHVLDGARSVKATCKFILVIERLHYGVVYACILFLFLLLLLLLF